MSVVRRKSESKERVVKMKSLLMPCLTSDWGLGTGPRVVPISLTTTLEADISLPTSQVRKPQSRYQLTGKLGNTGTFC